MQIKYKLSLSLVILGIFFSCKAKDITGPDDQEVYQVLQEQPTPIQQPEDCHISGNNNCSQPGKPNNHISGN